MIRLILISVLLSLPWLVSAQQTQQDFEKEVNEFSYRHLKNIEYFGIIHVRLKNAESNKIGLNEGDLTDYLKLRYKNNFANIPFRDLRSNLADFTKEKVGLLLCSVWTVGDDYPIAFHVECKAGPAGNPSILTDAYLGYGNKRNVPDTIKKVLDEIVSGIAIRFYKARGEM